VARQHRPFSPPHWLNEFETKPTVAGRLRQAWRDWKNLPFSRRIKLVGYAALVIAILELSVVAFAYERLLGFWQGLLINLGSDFLGVALAVLVINALQERAQDEQLKQRLIREMSSKIRDVAVPAAEEMKLRGWGFGDDRSLAEVRLVEANLQGADLSGANLSAANLRKANLNGAKLLRSQLHFASLDEADLSGAKMDECYLAQTHLEKANLARAKLWLTRLDGAYLEGAVLQEADLSSVNLRGADLHRANLNKANLTQADLQGVNLKYADLDSVCLQNAKLQDASLVGANLRNTILWGANLAGADLKQADLTGAEYDRMTVWPDNFDPTSEEVMRQFGGAFLVTPSAEESNSQL